MNNFVYMTLRVDMASFHRPLGLKVEQLIAPNPYIASAAVRTAASLAAVTTATISAMVSA